MFILKCQAPGPLVDESRSGSAPHEMMPPMATILGPTRWKEAEFPRIFWQSFDTNKPKENRGSVADFRHKKCSSSLPTPSLPDTATAQYLVRTVFSRCFLSRVCEAYPPSSLSCFELSAIHYSASQKFRWVFPTRKMGNWWVALNTSVQKTTNMNMVWVGFLSSNIYLEP